jgi:predicted phosphodiesterase
MNKRDIAREYRKQYPDMPTLKLARIMYKDNNLLFNNVERARSTLREIEGKAGKEKRSNDIINSEYYMKESRPKNPYNLPESHQEKRDPFILPKGCDNILLISDLHIPYHDIDAITLALDYGKENKVNTIFINGDLIDNHQVSRFESDPRKRSVKQEFDATKSFLVSLRSAFPDASIYWLKGNHCYIDGTEVLTERGFIDFNDLREDDLVAQFDMDMKISYHEPISILKRDYSGVMYDINTGYSRQVVTNKHRVLVGNDFIHAENIITNDLKNIAVTGDGHFADYDISDDLLRLIVNVVCDGCLVLDKKYAENKLSKAKSIYNLLNGKKEFPSFFRKLSKRQANIIYEELSITDGCIKDNGIFWTTTSKNDVDTIQEMAILNNMYFKNYGEYHNKSGFDNSKVQYKIKFRKDYSTNSHKSITQFDYNGIVHCLEMPLGTMITRYKTATAFSGNCIRWEKFLLAKVREIWDDPYFTLEERLRLNEERVVMIDDKTLVKAGKLSITHGHHIFKGIFSPVNPARGAFLRAKQSVIVGHLHRSSYHPEVDLDGKVIGCWSTGCLCELKPNYSPMVSNSQHGFAHILVEKNGDYTVKNYQIINGKIL